MLKNAEKTMDLFGVDDSKHAKYMYANEFLMELQNKTSVWRVFKEFFGFFVCKYRAFDVRF